MHTYLKIIFAVYYIIVDICNQTLEIKHMYIGTRTGRECFTVPIRTRSDANSKHEDLDMSEVYGQSSS